MTSPSRAAAAKEEQHLLLRALRTLPLADQLIVELSYWERLTTAEIGEVLEIPQGTVKWRLSQARGALRTAIERAEASEALRTATITNLDAWAGSLRALLDRDDESDQPDDEPRQP